MKYLFLVMVFFIGCGEMHHELSGEATLNVSYKDCYELPKFGTHKAILLGYSQEECIRDVAEALSKRLSNING